MSLPVRDGHDQGWESETGKRALLHARAIRHSRSVRAFRFVIPAITVAGIATLAATTYAPGPPLPSAPPRPVLEGGKVLMASPRLSGTNKGEAPYAVNARKAYQDMRKPGLVELVEIDAKLPPVGATGEIRLVAPAGLLDTKGEVLDLQGRIMVTTGAGDTILLESAKANLKANTLESQRPVSITGPRGDIRADALSVSENHVISFIGNVRARFPVPDARRRNEASAGDGTEAETSR